MTYLIDLFKEYIGIYTVKKRYSLYKSYKQTIRYYRIFVYLQTKL